MHHVHFNNRWALENQELTLILKFRWQKQSFFKGVLKYWKTRSVLDRREIIPKEN